VAIQLFAQAPVETRSFEPIVVEFGPRICSGWR